MLESEELFEYMLKAAQRSNRKRSVENVKSACEYLQKESLEITAASVARFLKASGKKPDTAQVIRNDTTELKAYVNLRKKEMALPKPRSNSDPFAAYNELLNLPKEDLAQQVIDYTGRNRELLKKYNEIKMSTKDLYFYPEKLLRPSERGTTEGVDDTTAAAVQKCVIKIKQCCNMEFTPIGIVQTHNDKIHGQLKLHFPDESITPLLADLCGMSVTDFLSLGKEGK